MTRNPRPIVLKPCPFCGAPPASRPWQGGTSTTTLIECVCEVGPSVMGDTFTDAAQHWNSRVTP